MNLRRLPGMMTSSHSSDFILLYRPLRLCLAQELKGNIRVFCRVRPLMIDEAEGNDLPTVQYPSSTELQGRGIELVQSAGNKLRQGSREYFLSRSLESSVSGDQFRLAQFQY